MRRIVQGLSGGCLAAALIVGCGGESFTSGDSGGGGSAGSAAGAGGSGTGGSSGGSKGGSSGTGGTGGASGTAGATGGSSGSSGKGGSGGSVAGTSGASGSSSGGAAGTVVTGGTSGMGGTGNVGGAADLCALAPDPGPCRGAEPRYAFDVRTGLCRPFTYGGCEGNENNFESPEACFAVCGGQGELDPALCESPLDCTLMPAECCGGCGEQSLGNVFAVNSASVGSVTTAMGCHLVDCVPCKPAPNPWLSATCREGRCIAYDARQTELTVCAAPEDCVLRAGLSCCASCNAGAGDFVAINSNVDLTPWACGSGPIGCAGCISIPPPNVSSACEGGRCQVLISDTSTR